LDIKEYFAWCSAFVPAPSGIGVDADEPAELTKAARSSKMQKESLEGLPTLSEACQVRAGQILGFIHRTATGAKPP
jgi:hypothetical protein